MSERLSLPEQVRESCAALIDRARFVSINPEGIDRSADAFLSERSTANASIVRSAEFDEDAAMRSLTSNAINFGSGYHDLVRKLPGHSGSRTMNVRLARYFDATGAPDASRLRTFTMEDCSQIFGQELDGGALEELMSRFAQALQDLGTFVAAHGGSARRVLEGCHNSAAQLALLLTDMPYYRDVESVDGLAVSFYKRAQITGADLAREGLWNFDDLPELTAFADNLVPHVLRLDGAIEVDPDIVETIDRGTPLAPGSRIEVELRAAAVVGVEELVRRIDKPAVRAMDVDEWLWNRGRQARYKAHPRPRSRSVFY